MERDTAPSSKDSRPWVPRRRRTVLACKSCRKSHVKCERDTYQSVCKSCAENSTECTYAPKHSWQSVSNHREGPKEESSAHTRPIRNLSGTIHDSGSDDQMESQKHDLPSYENARYTKVNPSQTTIYEGTFPCEENVNNNPSSGGNTDEQADKSYSLRNQLPSQACSFSLLDEGLGFFDAAWEGVVPGDSGVWKKENEAQFWDIHKDSFGYCDQSTDQV